MRRVVCTVMMLSCLPVAARGQQALSPQLVTAIKAATVFVKVKAEDMAGSGSGFVISTSGDTAYIVTNRHVVEPKYVGIVVVPDRRSVGPRGGSARRGPGMRGIPQPFPPPLPFRPGFPGSVQQEEEPHYSARLVVREFKNAEVTAVFQSGMKDEQSVRGKVVAVDPEEDLAVIRVSGVTQAVKPIKYVSSPQLSETMPIYVFGFPLGEDLATGKRSPAITVGKGTVSSLRTDDDGNLAVVQIDAALNHGNSGGPVVDAQGRLVGVAVARITEDESQNISFAVPTRAVARMMQGRPDRAALTTTKDSDDRTMIHVAVRLIDPLQKIKSAEFHYLSASSVTDKPKPSDSLDKLPGCHALQLKIENGVASGDISLKKGVTTVSLLHQTVSIGESGKKLMSDNAVDSVVVAVPPRPVAAPATPNTRGRPSMPGAPNAPAPVVAGETRPAPTTGSVGLHFIGTGGALAGTAGVAPMNKWNNAAGYSFASQSLVDNSGAKSGATFSLDGATSVWRSNTNNPLLNGYVASSQSKPMTLTINGIPYERYTLYVYVGDATLGNQAKVTVNGKTYYYTPEGGAQVGYVAITNTNSASHQLGNFIEVEGLAGASQNVVLAGTTQQYSGLCGVEIVNTTPGAVAQNLPTSALQPGIGSLIVQPPTNPGSTIPPGFSGAPQAGIPERIFGGAGPQFRDTAPAKGMLVGFEVGLGKWANTENVIVSAVRPIYVNERGEEVLGNQHGKVNGQTIRMKARQGYAVGAITAKSVAALDGFSVTFMKIDKDRLILADKYESEWVGGGGDLPQATVGGGGAPAIGIVGNGNDASCSGMGLVFAPPN
jgi:S1-C subfamily serine protease